MKKFSFMARDQKGRKVKGVVETNSQKEAVGMLRKRGLVVVDLNLYKKSPQEYLALFFQRINLAQISSLTRQLATMVNSGLSIIDTLELLKKQFAGRYGNVNYSPIVSL